MLQDTLADVLAAAGEGPSNACFLPVDSDCRCAFVGGSVTACLPQSAGAIDSLNKEAEETTIATTYGELIYLTDRGS